jgi:glucosyl-dolichyl phosphate glucuronosyltransferase
MLTLPTRSPAASGSGRVRAPIDAPQVSVVMCTYNRGDLLGDAIASVLAQQDHQTPPFEVLVVDNNSNDRTREVVERFAAADRRLRYIFESEQGLSHARNAAILEARAPLIAFTDDDVRAEPCWVAGIQRAFDEHPEVDVVGGRVLPIWPLTPPDWLTRDHWAPLALVDYGDVPVAVTDTNPICLVGANLAFRRSVFDTVGVFAADVQRIADGIGSLEDHEFLLRLLRSGRQGLYDPRIVIHAQIQRDRLHQRYHRRWHVGHGHFHSLLRSAEMEKTGVGTLFGVPAHLYRQALGDLGGWLRARASADAARAFHHETRLRFFSGFFRTRHREFLDKPRHERLGELRHLLRAPVARAGRRLPQPAATGIGPQDE